MNRFKKISRSDIALLNKHYYKHEPYSDFNVVSMWGYMVPGARYLHKGNATLYEMTDYNDGGVFYSVFGEEASVDLVRRLCKRSQVETLRLEGVPESTCHYLKSWQAVKSIEEDISNHDYIFDVRTIAQMESPHLHSKLKKIHKLQEKHPNLTVTFIDHQNPVLRQQMYRVFRRWITQAHATDWTREYRALQRELSYPFTKMVCLGAFDGKKMIGFTVNEVEKNEYYQGHFGKADYRYPGLGILLERETAQYMLDHFDSKYINLQQDLGIEGIRYYKESLGPIKKLRKYTVTIDASQARAEQ